jgi:hypothetical protein
VRKTDLFDDVDNGLAMACAGPALAEYDRILNFWFKPGRENFIVLQGDEPLGFYQIETVGRADQVRIHMQAAPAASPKKILAAITKLVPLLEKALAGRGVRAIFFTSKSEAMAQFIAQRFRFEYAGDGGADGVIMAKGIGTPTSQTGDAGHPAPGSRCAADARASAGAAPQEPNRSMGEQNSGAGLKQE